jgi:hypothetical protein
MKKILMFVFVAAALTACENSELEDICEVVSRTTEETDDRAAPKEGEGGGQKESKMKEDPNFPRWPGESDEAYMKRLRLLKGRWPNGLGNG